jgi:cation:H+ antiporter
MATATVTFVAMAAVIVLAGAFLARLTDRIAELTGMGRTIAGLVLLAAATSLPELTIGWNSVSIGAPDLMAGDVLGSSLMNLLILAVLDLVTRTRGTAFSRSAATHALSATAGVLMTAAVLLALLLDWKWTVWRVGPGSAMILLTYLFSLRLIYFDEKSARERLDEPRSEGMSLRVAVAGYLVAAAAIFLAAPRLSRSADQLAELTGFGHSFFGTVFIAAVTSLPEAVTTLAAIRLGRTDMAVGNIFGSNAFNMAILAVADCATPGALLSEISKSHAVTAAAVIFVTAAATLSLLYRAEKRWWIIEPDAALVILLVLGSLYLVYAVS